MQRFDDFDAWGEAVSGASLRMVCDGVETPTWSLGLVDLDCVLLQVASEGGGNICYGGNVHVGTQLFLPLTRAAEHVVNGEPLDDESLFVIPRGADFRIRLRRRAHAWCSIALPDGVLPDGHGPASSGRVTCAGGKVERLRHLVHTIAGPLLDRPAGTAAHAAAGRRLLAAATACLPVAAAAETGSCVGRPRLDRAEIVRRAMAAIEVTTVMPTTTELADVVGVTGRTLQRTFQESFGVPPKRYLLLRELHAIRRSLRAEGRDATVADVLVRHGVWEFGRFAARYRRHFGEFPSETLRQAGI
ncbi:MAG: helix-turn-helix domain-containing protein [Planctomycetaceae bacterium]